MAQTVFGITLGDPCGIGTEITLKALHKRPEYQSRALLFGPRALLEHYAKELGYNLRFNTIGSIDQFNADMINVYDPLVVRLEEIPIGKVCALGGEIAFASVVSAIKFALSGDISSVVTAPLNKEALHLAGHEYAGHTEIFGAYTKGSNYAMLLFSKQLKAIHVSTHVSLRKACALCTKNRVLDVIRLGDQTMKKVGYAKVRIAVAGLNPHAGENGLFGDEELNEIIPAINQAKAEGILAEGPVPPDTVYLKAIQGQYDLVVAMYHDQGHIPLKMLSFDSGVNITVGLDVVRTSVDHGTAFDIAGKLIANEQSLIEAIEIGQRL
jgi:4-hydroxythreonine-4-phosphate dehydrogenase